MAVSDEFLDYIVDQLSAWNKVVVRKMFGGAGLFFEGRMFGLVAGDTAYLKADESSRAAFEQSGSAPFRPYPGKPMTMSYWEIPAEVLEDRAALAEWAEISLAVARKKK